MFDTPDGGFSAETPFRIGSEVRLTDIDLNGHVNHGAYLSYAEQARIRHLSLCGLSPQALVRCGVAIVILHLEIDYDTELGLEDSVSATSLYEFSQGRKSFANTSSILKDETVAAELRTVLGVLDLRTRKLIAEPRTALIHLSSQLAKEARS